MGPEGMLQRSIVALSLMGGASLDLVRGHRRVREHLEQEPEDSTVGAEDLGVELPVAEPFGGAPQHAEQPCASSGLLLGRRVRP
jgi:hypothetical protein